MALRSFFVIDLVFCLFSVRFISKRYYLSLFLKYTGFEETVRNRRSFAFLPVGHLSRARGIITGPASRPTPQIREARRGKAERGAFPLLNLNPAFRRPRAFAREALFGLINPAQENIIYMFGRRGEGGIMTWELLTGRVKVR